MTNKWYLKVHLSISVFRIFVLAVVDHIQVHDAGQRLEPPGHVQLASVSGEGQPLGEHYVVGINLSVFDYLIRRK